MASSVLVFCVLLLILYIRNVYSQPATLEDDMYDEIKPKFPVTTETTKSESIVQASFSTNSLTVDPIKIPPTTTPQENKLDPLKPPVTEPDLIQEISSEKPHTTVSSVGLNSSPSSNMAEIMGSQTEIKTSSMIPPIIEDVEPCTMSHNPDRLTQDQFSTQLTKNCRYDKLTRPPTDEPLDVTMQLDIRHIEAIEQLQFKMHMLVYYRYIDHRLDYSKISPKRRHMIGGDKLRDKIWIPHIVVTNERETSIMGLEDKDIYVSISPKGEVVYTYRMTAKIYCWMDLQKFPFDDQICDVHFKSWTYNASDLLLHWEEVDPVLVASQLHLTEYKLVGNWTYSNQIPANFQRGAFVGQYSNLVFKFQIAREIGYYIMDYFLPSIMLVCTSWVTFWLQADNAAPRITLGTSTMLSFITLASGQSKNLPKVSYIKASEIWFLGCTMFIFASIAEFAFVNIIWRRKKKVELKKVNSKYILKSTLTPKLARRQLQKSNSINDLHKSHSCSSLDGGNNKKMDIEPAYNNYLTVHSFHSFNVPTITMQSEDDLIPPSKGNSFASITMPEPINENVPVNRWTTMTPQEIAIWIDKRSRFVFPLGFFIFNIFYWSFVYLL